MIVEMAKDRKKRPALDDVVERLRENNKIQSAADLAVRLVTVRDHAGWSQTRLAKEVGVSRGAVGQWESGRTEPSAANLREIAVRAGVDYDWLATGRGHFFSDPQGPLPPGVKVRLEITIQLSEKTTLLEASEKLEPLKALAKQIGKVAGHVFIGDQMFKF
jgi:transcriptional regulator with XRE-family HTH domain